MAKKLITDHNKILNRLNEYLLLNLPSKEIRTATGFKKMVQKMKKGGAVNSFLVAVNVDLSAFEELCKKFGCWEELFTGSLIPAVDKYLETRGLSAPKVSSTVKRSLRQPGELIPDDGCKRQQPILDICGAV